MRTIGTIFAIVCTTVFTTVSPSSNAFGDEAGDALQLLAQSFRCPVSVVAGMSTAYKYGGDRSKFSVVRKSISFDQSEMGAMKNIISESTWGNLDEIDVRQEALRTDITVFCTKDRLCLRNVFIGHNCWPHGNCDKDVKHKDVVIEKDFSLCSEQAASDAVDALKYLISHAQ
ncbi:hypothetical protein [Mesorhizobium argentiipisi]|uniref:Uncharacterized protein n=1 Tax=Mesorhizobium argentiipisi TaxID=3015175 RepID=A0ABU8K9K8_9HYPH